MLFIAKLDRAFQNAGDALAKAELLKAWKIDLALLTSAVSR